MNEYRIGVFPSGNCIEPSLDGTEDMAEAFRLIDSGNTSAEVLEIARTACAQCLQLPFCQSQRENIAIELWRRGTGTVVVSGEQLVTATEKPQDIARPTFRFNLTKLPEDPKQALDMLRQGWRADQLVVRGKPAKGAVTISEAYLERLQQTDPELYGQAIDTLGRDEVLKGVQTLASILFQQKDFTNYSRKIKKQTSVRESQDGRRTNSRYSPQNINLEKDAAIIDEYVRETIQIRAMGYSKPSNKSIIYDADYYRTLMEKFSDKLSAYTIDFTVTGNRRDPASALADVAARYSALRTANPDASEAYIQNASTRKTLTHTNIDERIETVKAGFADVPYITTGFVRSLISAHPNGDTPKLLGEIVDRVSRLTDEYKYNPDVTEDTIRKFARSYHTDESCRKAIESQVSNLKALEGSVSHPEATSTIFHRYYSADLQKTVAEVTDYCERVDRLLSISDGSVQPSNIRIAARRGASTWPEVRRLDAIREAQANLNRNGYTSRREAVRAAIHAISHKYPYAEVSPTSLSLYQCMQEGFITAATVDSDLLPEDVHPDTHAVYTIKKHGYITFSGAFQWLSPEERLLFAQYHGLAPLLYGRETSTVQLGSILEGRSLQDLYSQSILPAITELQKEPDGKTALPMATISDDLYHFDTLLANQESTTVQPTQEKKISGQLLDASEVAFVVGGYLLHLQTVGDTLDSDDPRATWLQSKIARLYIPTEQSAALQNCTTLIDHGILNVIGTTETGFRVVLNNAFYAGAVSDLQRAVIAHSLGADRLLYGCDLAKYLQEYPEDQTRFDIRYMPRQITIDEVVAEEPTIVPTIETEPEEQSVSDTQTEATGQTEPAAEADGSEEDYFIAPQSLEEMIEQIFGTGYHLASMTAKQRTAITEELMKAFARHLEHPNHRAAAKGYEHHLLLAWKMLQGEDAAHIAHQLGIDDSEIDKYLYAGTYVVFDSFRQMPASRLKPIHALLDTLRPTRQPKPRTARSRTATSPPAAQQQSAAQPVEPKKKPTTPTKKSTATATAEQAEPSTDYFGQDATSPSPTDDVDDAAAPEQLQNHLYADAMGQYLRQLRKTPLLSAEEEVELSKAIEAGILAQAYLDAEDYHLGTRSELQRLVQIGAQAKERMILSNLRLVVKRAVGYAKSSRTLKLEDLVMEGNLGLMHAVEKFDYTKGYKFSTYATNWINQAIMRAKADKDNEIRIPVHMYELIRKVAGFRARYLSEHQNEPTAEVIVKELGITRANAETALESMRLQPFSLNLSLSDEDNASEFGDLIEDATAIDPLQHTISALASKQVVIQDILRQQFNTPSFRDGVQTLILHYGLNLMPDFIPYGFAEEHNIEPGRRYTFDEIGVMLGITRESARQREVKVMNALRHPAVRSHLHAALVD